MMTSLMKYFYLWLMIVFVLSCASTNAGIASSNIPINPAVTEIQYITTDTVRKDWWVFDVGVFGLPLEEPPIDEALKELQQKHEGDALINIRYYTQRSVFLMLSKNSIIIKADVVKLIPKTTPPPEPKDTRERKR
ncbi:MAG: hypothetical protein NZ853_08385 [Leptospiraceae bacterium]|nr:hypothetical protein [Leptospiraceae bacterium]